MDDEFDDGMLINFAAIFLFLISGGGVNKLKQASKYRLQLGHSHSAGHDDHMAIGKWRRDDNSTVQNDEQNELAEVSSVAVFRNSHNLSIRTIYRLLCFY